MARLVIAESVTDAVLARILAPWGGDAAACRTDIRTFLRGKIRDYETAQMLATKNAEIQAAIGTWTDPFAGA